MSSFRFEVSKERAATLAAALVVHPRPLRDRLRGVQGHGLVQDALGWEWVRLFGGNPGWAWLKAASIGFLFSLLLTHFVGGGLIEIVSNKNFAVGTLFATIVLQFNFRIAFADVSLAQVVASPIVPLLFGACVCDFLSSLCRKAQEFVVFFVIPVLEAVFPGSPLWHVLQRSINNTATVSLHAPLQNTPVFLTFSQECNPPLPPPNSCLHPQ